MMGWDTNSALRGLPVVPYDRRHAPNPLITCYQDRDGKWFWLLLLQGDRHWPDLLKALEAPHLGEDPRFVDLLSRMANATDLTDELDKILHTRSLAEWAPIFDRDNVWWAPVNTVAEVIEDPVAQAAGAFIEIAGPEGSPLRQVATPVDFYGTPVEPTHWAPELGQDTETILLDQGYDWDQIIAMKESGAIP
jgi:crotonobetainyl-CoA:carnitine CoA-transferase CaiB-like acyl-CoA transferase